MMAIDDSVDARLISGILGEFREMPGLSLTIEQPADCGAVRPSPAGVPSKCSWRQASSDGLVMGE